MNQDDSPLLRKKEGYELALLTIKSKILKEFWAMGNGARTLFF
ncbi:hypothetical protein [Heyndrickxia oleronia]|nr:hypothetical protein [Heyndrickxia oleronia]